MTVRGCTCGAHPFGLHDHDCPEWLPIAAHYPWTATHVALVHDGEQPDPACRIVDRYPPDDVQ